MKRGEVYTDLFPIVVTEVNVIVDVEWFGCHQARSIAKNSE